jgi:hypothetical protein
LDKLNATATSDSDDDTASVTSEKSYHFGGKQAGHDSSDSENDDGSTTTPHLDATFIRPRNHSLAQIGGDSDVQTDETSGPIGKDQ